MDVEKDVSQNNYCSSMQQGTDLQLYFVVADPKVGE